MKVQILVIDLLQRELDVDIAETRKEFTTSKNSINLDQVAKLDDS